MEEQENKQQEQQEQQQNPVQKLKKPRPYSFIQAFQEWKKQNMHEGLCPKKGSKEYDEIMEIYKKKKQ